MTSTLTNYHFPIDKKLEGTIFKIKEYEDIQIIYVGSRNTLRYLEIDVVINGIKVTLSDIDKHRGDFRCIVTQFNNEYVFQGKERYTYDGDLGLIVVVKHNKIKKMKVCDLQDSKSKFRLGELFLVTIPEDNTLDFGDGLLQTDSYLDGTSTTYIIKCLKVGNHIMTYGKDGTYDNYVVMIRE